MGAGLKGISRSPRLRCSEPGVVFLPREPPPLHRPMNPPDALRGERGGCRSRWGEPTHNSLPEAAAKGRWRPARSVRPRQPLKLTRYTSNVGRTERAPRGLGHLVPPERPGGLCPGNRRGTVRRSPAPGGMIVIGWPLLRGQPIRSGAPHQAALGILRIPSLIPRDSWSGPPGAEQAQIDPLPQKEGRQARSAAPPPLLWA